MLPADNAGPWPPTGIQHITGKLAEWAAWYAGDTAALAMIYAPSSQTGPRPTSFNGGVAGWASRHLPNARWFWGQPTPTGQQPARLHIPIAADIATVSADLLFGEELKITQPDTDQAMLDAFLDDLDLSPTLLETGEIAAALGGAYLRVVWDDQIAGHALVDVVHADSAIPTFQFGRLRTVIFWNIIGRDGNTVWRHLEEHSPGRIEHGLYKGGPFSLGQRRPLADHPSTASITLDDEAGISTGWPGLTAEYIPNMRPQRLWRTDPDGRSLGRSDLDEVEPIMDALDESWTSLMRDIRLSKARILVPENQLESGPAGSGSVFDLEREVFTQLAPIAGSAQNATVQATLMQPAIRVDDHLRTCVELTTQIVRQAGYSAATFGLEAISRDVTATEVTARERRSLSTREKKTRYAGRALGRILHAAQWINAQRFAGPAPASEPPAVEFPPTVAPGMVETAQTLQMLKAASAISTHTRVEMLHPDWAEDAIQTEAMRIIEEDGMTVPDIGPVPTVGDYMPPDQASA